ncbi:phage portal protein [Hyphobacterium sp.]|uniref:phage portal protein n=1 Tax=Hyphobacterium sp. TaxID=2004662 RepID=UPI003B5225D1
MGFSKSSRIRAKARARAIGAVAKPTADGSTLMVPYRSRTATRAGDPMEPVFAKHHASRGSADRDWLRDRLTAVPRIRRLVMDEPLAASAVEQKLALMFGGQYRFASSPDASAFGLEPGDKAIRNLSRSIEAALAKANNDPEFRVDWEQELPPDLIIELAQRHHEVDGEAVVMFNALSEEEAWPFQTALQVIDPDRLANPLGAINTDTLRDGVQFDERGRVDAYHILNGHPYDVGLAQLKAMTGEWFPRWDPDVPGRPRVVHLFKKRRAGQSRGISQFVSVLSRLQSLSDFNEAELRSRVLNALIFASISSNMDGEYISEMFSNAGDSEQLLATRNRFYEESDIRVGGHNVIRTFPGDEVQINQAQRDTNAYADTIWAIASQSGAGLDLAAELLSRDYTRTTFLSGRMSQIDARRTIARSKRITNYKLRNPLNYCLIMEAFYAGELDLPRGAPDFFENPAAYTAGKHLDGRHEYVDPVKEAMGDRLRLENGTIAPSDLAAEHGQDFQELVGRIARDQKFLEENGVSLGDVADMARAARDIAADDPKT